MERKGRATSSLLYTLQTFFGTQSRRRIQQGRLEAEKSVLSWQREASSGRRLLDPLSQGTRKGTAVSHAIDVHDSVPADCIKWYPREEKKLEFRDSTPGPAPKIDLKSVRKLRQQQQQDTQRGSGMPLAEHSQGKPIGTPNPRGTWTPIVEEEHDFEVELTIQRTPQDVALEDQGRMTIN